MGAWGHGGLGIKRPYCVASQLSQPPASRPIHSWARCCVVRGECSPRSCAFHGARSTASSSPSHVSSCCSVRSSQLRYQFEESCPVGSIPRSGGLRSSQMAPRCGPVSTAARIRTEFADVLDTPAGRIGEQVALAEMLQAVGRGWYRELAPLLRQCAEELTGILPR